MMIDDGNDISCMCVDVGQCDSVTVVALDTHHHGHHHHLFSRRLSHSFNVIHSFNVMLVSLTSITNPIQDQIHDP